MKIIKQETKVQLKANEDCLTTNKFTKFILEKIFIFCNYNFIKLM
jgi:hypothetical protein